MFFGTVHERDMPLLTELGRLFLRVVYKHGAPTALKAKRALYFFFDRTSIRDKNPI